VSLAILRACNELLRRLSRAEDAVFCGRVFIFLFQSFPLGDRSSVNRHGDYNSENVTIVEDSASPDVLADAVPDVAMTDVQDTADNSQPKDSESDQNQTNEADDIYTIFWGLQKSFAYPPRLFDKANLEDFKGALQKTLRKFQEVPQVLQTSSNDNPRGIKRKANELEQEEVATSFNPKYLTSRELFQLEVSVAVP
jgi:THO complex subunit 1